MNKPKWLEHLEWLQRDAARAELVGELQLALALSRLQVTMLRRAICDDPSGGDLATRALLSAALVRLEELKRCA